MRPIILVNNLIEVGEKTLILNREERLVWLGINGLIRMKLTK